MRLNGLGIEWLCVCVACLLMQVGCDTGGKTAKTDASKKSAAKNTADDHAHDEKGEHGAEEKEHPPHASRGGHAYRSEDSKLRVNPIAGTEPNQVKVYILDEAGEKDVSIAASEITFVMQGGKEKKEFKLQAENPVEGKANCFVGVDPGLLVAIEGNSEIHIALDGKECHWEVYHVEGH
jgi:hypothetical protein